MKQIILVATVLAGCAAPTPTTTPTVNLGVVFDPAAARAMLVPGVNQIRGSAFLRQQGGGVVTCAGRDVTLFPATLYAQRVFAAIYGTDEGAARRLTRRVTVSPPSDDYGRVSRTTQSDAQGSFTFDRLADGDYFVETVVTWVVGGVENGGAIMRRVKVSGGAVASVVISP